MSPFHQHTGDYHTVGGFEPATGGLSSTRDRIVLALISFGLVALALYIASRQRSWRQSSNNYHNVVSEAVTQQRLWVAEKSRGVSKNASSMPNKHSPQDPSSWCEDNFDEPRATSQGTESYRPMDDTSKGLKGVSGAPAHNWTMQNRPRPPPPLTPPVLSGGPLGFAGRPSQLSHSSVVDFDKNFFGLPNPDYMLATSDSESATSSFQTQSDHSGIPRRRSYTKVLPLVPEQDRHSLPSDVVTNTQHSGSELPSDHRIPTSDSREVNVQGEIISVLDDAGAGWKRHTRVYGGGVCLACLESEGKEGGGFYGANVRPEDKRH